MRTRRWLYTSSVVFLCGMVQVHAQTQVSDGEKALLAKARAQESRGREDLALESWKQVLLIDPNSVDAVAGIARADAAAGNTVEARVYLDKLRSMSPNDSRISEIENMQKKREASPKLAEAGRLAADGQYAQAMQIYRREYGNNPPPGDIALGYYETEAATPESRPAAVAGLRDLMHKYPNDPRYAISLGRILTYDEKTRAEGISLLEKYPNDHTASEALGQALGWSAANPAYSPRIRAYLKSHPDAALQSKVDETDAKQAKFTNNLAKNADERAAYNALAANKTADAEQRFQAILNKEPGNYRALAGLGFVRLKQQNFGSAADYFQKAQANGGKDKQIADGLSTSRFWMTMSEANAAAANNQFDAAAQNYQRALQMRPNSSDALDGLAGLYMKEQQPGQAVDIYARLVHAQSNSLSAWKGLFISEYQSGDPKAALATMQRFPAPVRAQLAKDPDYLTNLAQAYQAVGRNEDAGRVLEQAMALPFPNGGQGMKTGTQMQYASLLMEAQRYQPAVSIYKQVLVADPNNLDAYEGLVRALHAAGDDAGAIDMAQRMPQDMLAKAEMDPGFLETLASIYQSQNRLDIAQQLLEQALAQSQAQNHPPSVGLQLQLAGIYMQRGNSQQAFAIYQQVLTANPNRPDAWKGLVSALHTSDRDREALAELGQIPPTTLAPLNQDPQWLQVLASVYSGNGMNQQAMSTLHQASQIYQRGGAVPANISIQYAYLLMNADDNQDLYALLLSMGSRPDLTQTQRAEVQKIWALWSVRRANAEIKRGNPRRAVQILDAANRAFPNNVDVQKALAGGYQAAGEPKRAEAVYLQMDWSSASIGDYRAAISAALAANDRKQARVWLDPALKQYPNDPQILSLAAQYEQQSGDSPKAAEYYKASLDAMGPSDPTASLVSDMNPSDMTNGTPGGASQDAAQRLAGMLAPSGSQGVAISSLPPLNQAAPAPIVGPLPGGDYTPGMAPVQVGPNAMPMQTSRYAQPVQQPGYTTQPLGGMTHRRRSVNSNGQMTQPMQSAPPPTQRLGDYAPSSALHAPHTSSDGWTVRFASFRTPVVDELAEPMQQASGDTEIHVAPNAKLTYQEPFAVQRDKSGKVVKVTTPPAAAAPAPARTQQSAGMHLHLQTAATASSNPATASAARTVESAPVAYAPVAKGEHTRVAQYTSQPQQSAQPYPSQQGQPNGQTYPSQQQQQAQPQYQQAQPPQSVSQPAEQNIGAPMATPQSMQQQQAQSAYDQQQGTVVLPQGNSGYGAQQQTQPYTTTANGEVSQPAGQRYDPAYGSGFTGYYDYRLPVQQQPAYSRVLPPLSGGYSYQDTQLPRRPLSERERIENELDRIEGGYSPWLGFSPYFSYRSGTPGLDRLTVFAAPVEGSYVFDNSVRMTVIAKPVLLDSGTPTYPLTTPLGSLPISCGSTTNCPLYTQTASGTGGEVQFRTQNYGLSVGSTPGGFLVQNIIGSVFARPNSGPFTFNFVRDSIVDSQLSYAGLYDPGCGAGQTSGCTRFPIWGGVIANAGEVQFANGTDRNGFYAQGGAQYITGDHVLNNWRGDGDMGAYWRVKDFPGYGGLTVGANVFAMHYEHNLRFFTYGQGGYFSPNAYLLANIPVTFSGHSGANFHYRINGSLGVQAFNEDASQYYPLNPSLQRVNNVFESCGNVTSSMTTAQAASQLCYPTRSSISGNYLIDAEASYRITDHWYFGGFFNANNSRDYNSVTAGFYVRYMFRRQYASEEGPPTGIFPVNGLRPVLVP